jgi:predicted nucleotide-binding protein (sugar kinase/HSP70/actin superfamily)
MKCPVNDLSEKQARFSDDHQYIIDSKGKKTRFDDPRVTHVFGLNWNDYLSTMVNAIFEKRGWNCRTIGKTSPQSLRDAKKICSGRECLSCCSFASAAYTDMLENRSEDEISLYYYLNQGGPCQNGAWLEMWKLFARRLRVQNAIFQVHPDAANNYIGQGNGFGLELIIAFILNDIVCDAENVVKCIAKDKEEARATFAAETAKLVDSLKHGMRAVETALKQWARQLSKIPLQSGAANYPKVMVFGSAEVMLLHRPVSDYFIDCGIIPKVVDFTGFIYLINTEYCAREGLKRGRIRLEDQIKLAPLMMSLCDYKTNHKEVITAIKSVLVIKAIDALRKRYHHMARMDRVPFSNRYVSLREVTCEGNRIASVNPITETYKAVGEYVVLSRSDQYDGLMNIAGFNCQPAINAQTITRSLAATSDIPYASLDMEGPWLSASQVRILEGLSLQVRRYHEERTRTRSH